MMQETKIGTKIAILLKCKIMVKGSKFHEKFRIPSGDVKDTCIT